MNNTTKILVVAAAAIILIIAGMIFKETKTQTNEINNITLSPENNAKKSQATVNVRYVSSLSGASPHEFAKELGFYKELNLNLIDTGSVQGGPEGILALGSGSTDIGSGTAWSAIINAKARGTKIKGVVPGRGSADNPYKWVVLQNSSIKTAKDLVGKKLATNTLGGTGDYVTREYLKRNGISREQVEFIALPTTSFEQALREKQVDVIIGSGTPILKTLAGGEARILFNETEIVGDYMATTYPVSEKFIAENPDAVKRFVEGYVKAVDWAKENPEEANRLYAKLLKDKGGDPGLAKYWTGFGVREHALLQDSDVQIWIDWMVSDSILKDGQINPSDIYTNEFNPYYKK
ncbi:MAG: ABC transporter substrate-binding protein [Candidatus Methanoperedens sp.]|nr:ABC transporter substrate-binding protein [Candidatus Methanoperedens sp.]